MYRLLGLHHLRNKLNHNLVTTRVLNKVEHDTTRTRHPLPPTVLCTHSPPPFPLLFNVLLQDIGLNGYFQTFIFTDHMNVVPKQAVIHRRARCKRHVKQRFHARCQWPGRGRVGTHNVLVQRIDPKPQRRDPHVLQPYLHCFGPFVLNDFAVL